MRITVTGGAGFVGSCLLPVLLNEGHDVTVLDSLHCGYYGLLPHLGNPRFHFVHGDIRNTKMLREAVKDADFVVHLAAIVGYPACQAQPQLARAVNHLATRKLVQTCTAPILFSSTGSCYGNITDECTEDSPIDPITLYGKTKVLAEQEIRKHKDFVILRFSTGFGMSLRPRLDLLVNDFVMQAVKNKELIVFEKDYRRAFIHVQDMVRAINFTITHFNQMNHETYNVGSHSLNLTKEDVALHIKKFTDFYLKFAEFGHDPDKRNYNVNFDKINKIGFKTRYSLDYGIKEVMAALQFLDPKVEFFNNKVYQ
jgi:nucleoside-diphosphate-sugar epimerase